MPLTLVSVTFTFNLTYAVPVTFCMVLTTVTPAYCTGSGAGVVSPESGVEGVEGVDGTDGVDGLPGVKEEVLDGTEEPAADVEISGLLTIEDGGCGCPEGVEETAGEVVPEEPEVETTL